MAFFNRCLLVFRTNWNTKPIPLDKRHETTKLAEITAHQFGTQAQAYENAKKQHAQAMQRIADHKFTTKKLGGIFSGIKFSLFSFFKADSTPYILRTEAANTLQDLKEKRKALKKTVSEINKTVKTQHKK